MKSRSMAVSRWARRTVARVPFTVTSTGWDSEDTERISEAISSSRATVKP